MFQRVVRTLDHVLYAFASAGLVGSVGLAFAAVIMRYVFNFSLEWVEEGARYLALFAALLVAGPVLRDRGHVALDLLTSGLHGTRYELHRMAVALIALGVSSAVFVWGLRLVLQTYQFGMRTGSLQFPQWLPFSIVPLGMAVLMLFSLIEIVSAIQAIRSGNSESDPADRQPTHTATSTRD